MVRLDSTSMSTLLPRAQRLTTGQLIEQIKKQAIAVDPGWARRRYEQAVADRKVVGHRNADGSANLSGCNLPVDRVAAASGHIDALAKAVKRAGDCRPVDHIRADLFLGMTDGTYTGLDDPAIIELLMTTPAPDVDQPDNGGEKAAEGGGEEPTTDELADVAAQGDGAGGDEVGECGSQASGAAPTQPARATAGMELRVRLSTLLGRDQYPAELAGWGPLHAELARDLLPVWVAPSGVARSLTRTDNWSTPGSPAPRPLGTRARTAACRAVVELQVPATALRALAADSTTPADWAGVVADLTRQLDRDLPGEDRYRADADRRGPGAALRRYLEIRDRYCVMIGCRAPAHTADKDHTVDYANGGPTVACNLGDACRHDHRLKGEGGWTLHQPQPGVFRWTSRLGHVYQHEPPAILEPLPDPIPRGRLPYPLTMPLDGGENTEIWEDLAPDPDPEPDPPPELSVDISPF